MAIWDDVIPASERKIYDVGGGGKRMGLGGRAAVVVVDVNYDFIGDKPEPIMESIERWRYSCGKPGLGRSACDTAAARGGTGSGSADHLHDDGTSIDALDYGRDRDKNFRTGEATSMSGAKGPEIPMEIAPMASDIVISKNKASACFGTSLASYLVDFGVDTLLVTGVSTSGCVRATVVDGHAYNFRVCVVEEGCFDRSIVAHKVNLFDMHMKYADVVSLAETKRYLARHPVQAQPRAPAMSAQQRKRQPVKAGRLPPAQAQRHGLPR